MENEMTPEVIHAFSVEVLPYLFLIFITWMFLK